MAPTHVDVRGNFRRECYLSAEGVGYRYFWRRVLIPGVLWWWFTS